MDAIASILDPVQPTLSPYVWDHPEAPEPVLKPRVAHFIQKTVYAALERHGYARPHEWLHLCLTGSLTTYQYADDSDCDVSLFVDAQALPEWSRGEMIGIMISEVDGTKIPGTPYVLQDFVVAKKFKPADLYRRGLRSGYDIDHGRWIVPPEKERAHDVQAQEYGAYAYGLQVADKMERLLRYEPDKAADFWHQIHKRRMRDQAAGKGDYSDSNIIYKFLSKRGLIPQIAALTGEHIAGRLEDLVHESIDYGNAWVNVGEKKVQIELGDADPGELFGEVEEEARREYPDYKIDIGSEDREWNVNTPGWSKFAAYKRADGDAQAMLDANAGRDLAGLPGQVRVPGYGPLQFHSNGDIQRVANEYNQANGLGEHPADYVPVNPQTAAQIAQEYERMPHAPQDPRVAQAYQALAQESMAQYRHAVNNGYRFEFYPEGQDPYPRSPREAVMDLHRNKHMYVYPTEAGYGQDQQGIDHPLLADSGERWGGRPVTHNDIFRAIHDFYGHGKEGLGFRAHGEDNAYRQHAAMFSPLAQQALASETRGQNSWVNFGPHGQTNQNANQAETVYAPQKAGLLPEWVADPSLHQAAVYARTAASNIANIAYQATLDNGGITVGLDGTQPTQGFAYSPAKNEETIVLRNQLTPEVIDHFVTDHYGLLRQPGHYLGMWVEGDHVFLDISVVHPDHDTALQQAQQANQLAMYDLGTFQEIPVRGTMAKVHGYDPMDPWVWQQGLCDAYALALLKEHPELRFGVAGYTHDGDPANGWAVQHYFAHDDTHAYDSLGRHPLPYRGRANQWDYQELESDPRWYGLPENGGPEDIEKALQHVRSWFPRG